MLTAIHRVHGKNGPWLTNGGYEYNVVLIAAALLLAELGPGGLSLDAARGRERSGSALALAVLGAGALGAVGSHALVASQSAPPPTVDAEQADAPVADSNTQGPNAEIPTGEEQHAD